MRSIRFDHLIKFIAAFSAMCVDYAVNVIGSKTNNRSFMAMLRALLGVLFTLGLVFAPLLPSAIAHFTGPSVQGDQSTVQASLSTRPGSYVVLEGNILSHLREDYYLLADETGEIRVEISADRFGGQQAGPSDTVRLMGEIDRSSAGPYIWVTTLQLISQ